MMNTFRYAFRFLRRQKHFTLINVLGLALSLACCIILTRYLYREATVENHCIDASTVIVPVEYYETSGTYMPDDLEFLKEDDAEEILTMFPHDVASTIAITAVSCFNAKGELETLNSLERFEWTLQAAAYCVTLPIYFQ